MKLRRFETPGLAHYAYLIADAGVAAVVDPSRDPGEYLRAARALGVRIDYVIETHRQEDFVMGAQSLAACTGARVVNGRHETFGHGDVRLGDGEELSIGGITLRALHTPGHTPESMSYAVVSPATPDDAVWAVFTGDTLLFGTTGRTDLIDASRVAEHAGLLYDSIHARLAPLPDGARVLPAHGPGSVCGSGIASLPGSTIGIEKQYNRAFTLSREAFVAAKAAEHIPRPPYFRHMEQVNLDGGLVPLARQVPLIDPGELAARAEHALLIDAREPEAYAGGHVPGSHAVWLDGLPSFGGWLAAPDTPLYLVVDRDEQADVAVAHLARIGVDGVRGVLRGGFGSWRASGRPIERSGVIVPEELASRLDELTVLDVREPGEYAEAHIPGAINIYVGELESRVGSLGSARHAPVAVTCSVGHRAGLGASILRRAGFADVQNLLGGMTAWRASELPTVR